MILDFNAKGGVIGNYNGIDAGSFYYDAESGELVDLKRLPGAVHSSRVYGINDLGQIVGSEDGEAILYANPGAVPIEVIRVARGRD